MASFQNLIRTWMKVWLWSCLAGFWFILSGLPETARGFNGLSWRSAGLARICGLELSKECFFAETSGNFNRQFKWEELSLDVIKNNVRIIKEVLWATLWVESSHPDGCRRFFRNTFCRRQRKIFFPFSKMSVTWKKDRMSNMPLVGLSEFSNEEKTCKRKSLKSQKTVKKTLSTWTTTLQ